MKDNSDNSKDPSQNNSMRNSGKNQNFNNSEKIVNKQFTSEKSKRNNEPNFIKRSSPIQPMPLFDLNTLKLENNNSINTNGSGMYFNENSYKLYPNYSPLTPQLLPNDLKHYSKKNFPSKEEVCKGNPDYSQKLKIPSSSPITQYFNMDNAFNKDFGFQLEAQAPNNFGETPISHLSQSDLFNCSPSDFFNRGTNYEITKNMKGINISEQDNEDDKNKNGKEEGDELYSMKLDNVNEENNFEDDNNIILNRINELKNKKMKDKTKTNNNSKPPKSFLSKKNNNNESKLIKLGQMENDYINNNKNEKKENNLNIIFNPINQKNDDNQIDKINNNFELLGISSNNNQNKNFIKEENSSSMLISQEITKKFEEFMDDNFGSPLILNKDMKEDLINNKNKLNISKNMNSNNNIFENNNLDYNTQMRNNLNNPQNNNDNLNYIKNMNISCTNLNINNFTNLNQNEQEANFNDPNHQLLYYLQYQNNSINLGNNGYNNNNFNKNKKQKQKAHYQNNNNNINNIQNDIYNDPQRINYYNQMNGVNMNNNQYLSQNNMNNQGYPFYVNNINSNNNVNQQNNSNEYNKRKKIKKLDNTLYMNKPLSYLAKNLNLLGKDQGACRYLQKVLNDHPLETIQYLYDPLCENILQLITDQFGNYLIQKIIIYLNEEQLFKILQIISQHFFEICSNTYGTRVLQKIIDYLTTPKLANYFFQLMKPLITPLLKELNGTFVVQKFANVYKQYSNEINEIIVENSHVLSTHRHGCCVIQKYLEIKDPIMTPNLLDKLVENCLLLIIDQFGNYVIQTILLMGNKKYGNKLAEKIAENVVYYAKHKYSSNVVEKCFDYCDGNYRMNLMINVQKKENLIELILDEHGNYVVQKVLLLSPSLIQKKMLRLIVPTFEKLKKFPYGERVINRLVTSYPFINDKNFLNE